MTLFEYLAIAFSLLFSFSTMRLVGGLPHAIDPARRYWIHISVVMVQLIGTAAIFWAFWSYRDVVWTFPRFLLALASPSLIYFASCTLVPEDPAAVTSWRTHYYAGARKYYFCLGAWAIVIATSVTLLVQMPLWHPARIVQAAVVVIAIVGAHTTRPRVHGGIAVLLLGLIVLGVLTITQPGSLAD